MTKKIVLPLLIVSGYYSHSQIISPTVYGSAGDYSSVSQGNNSWTIGEPVSESYIAASNIVTTGFHQPNSLNVVTYIKGENNNLNLFVYPNPVFNELTIDFNGVEIGNYNLRLTDAQGKIIYESNITIDVNNNKTHNLDFLNLAAANYMLTIANTKTELIKTFKILKNN